MNTKFTGVPYGIPSPLTVESTPYSAFSSTSMISSCDIIFSFLLISMILLPFFSLSLRQFTALSAYSSAIPSLHDDVPSHPDLPASCRFASPFLAGFAGNQPFLTLSFCSRSSFMLHIQLHPVTPSTHESIVFDASTLPPISTIPAARKSGQHLSVR